MSATMLASTPLARAPQVAAAAPQAARPVLLTRLPVVSHTALRASAQRAASVRTKAAESEAAEAASSAPAASGPGANWALDELKALDEDVERPPPPVYSLSFLWLDKNIAVAVDQVFGAQRSPMTEYFFWPRKDAWEELKAALEQRPWVSERDKVLLLNKTTEVINYWQDEGTKHALDEAQAKFGDCKFLGA